MSIKRGRGRGIGRPPFINIEQEPAEMTVTRERPQRTKNASRQKGPLTSVARQGYRNYFANDEDGRIEEMLELGYTPVINPSADTSDTAGGRDSKYGNAVKKSVGGGVKAILMEIPQEWYDEDYAEAQKEVDRSDEALNSNEIGQYGSVSINRN